MPAVRGGKPRVHTERQRPQFTERAVVTAGMPYGNKPKLHFGHTGGVFTPMDSLTRFLRKRLGFDNVISVSGTDGFGSPIVADYNAAVAAGRYSGTREQYTKENHLSQQATLERYHISLNLFGASSFGRFLEIHKEVGEQFIRTLFRHGLVEKRSQKQFWDKKLGRFLNGREVTGYCPIQGCKSEKAYADECDLGHPFEPSALLKPKSTLSDTEPELRDCENWYLKITRISKDPAALYRGFIKTPTMAGIFRALPIRIFRATKNCC